MPLPPPYLPEFSPLPKLTPVGPALADQLFRCEKYRCEMALRVCVGRQDARLELRATGKRFTKVPLALQFCASGLCEQGKAVRAQLAGVDLVAPRILTRAMFPGPPQRSPISSVSSSLSATPQPPPSALSTPPASAESLCPPPVTTPPANSNLRPALISKPGSDTGTSPSVPSSPRPAPTTSPALPRLTSPVSATFAASSSSATRRVPEPPPVHEEPMATCSSCTKTLSARNTVGICTRCKLKDRVSGTCNAEGCGKTLRKDSPFGAQGRCRTHPPDGATPAPKPAAVKLAQVPPAVRAMLDVSRVVALPGDAPLPRVEDLPLSYLGDCIAELQRRGEELDRLRALLARPSAA